MVESTRAPRFVLQLAIKYRAVGQTGWREGTTENISRSGVLFRAPAIFEVDTPIEMRVALPVGGTPEVFPEVFCSGRVVRRVVGSGEESRAALAAAITYYRLESSKPEQTD